MSIRKPDFVTFTGVDDRTPMDRLAALSGRYPIEWGILLDPDRQGKVPRFPAAETLQAIAGSGLRLAAHLCGGHTVAVREERLPDIAIDLDAFERIQINSHKVDVGTAVRFGRLVGRRCILPCGGDAFPESDGVDWLHDLSGGRGRETRIWPRHPGRLAGYAGGIGPENVAAMLVWIDADGAYWIDMETKIRTDDWLDLDLCELVCQDVFDR